MALTSPCTPSDTATWNTLAAASTPTLEPCSEVWRWSILQTGEFLKAGEKIPRPETTWKVADVVEMPTFAGPLVYIPVTGISQENAEDPNLFANKYQGAPNGLSECEWE